MSRHTLTLRVVVHFNFTGSCEVQLQSQILEWDKMPQNLKTCSVYTYGSNCITMWESWMALRSIEVFQDMHTFGYIAIDFPAFSYSY